MTKFVLSLVAATNLIYASLLIKQGDFGLTPFFYWLSAMLLTIYNFLPLNNLSLPKLKIVYPSISFITLIILYLLRILFLKYFPYIYFHGDEGIISSDAQVNFINSISNGNWNLLGSGKSTLNNLPALWYFLQGFFIHIFGSSIFGIKIFSLITDLMICLLGYRLVSKYVDRQIGLIFVLLYTTFPIAIHFSLTGYQNIQSTFFLMLSLFFLLESFDDSQYFNLKILCSGLASALSFYFYLSSLVVPIILLIMILILNITKRINLKRLVFTIITFLVGLIEGLIPFLIYSIYHYSFIFGRKEAALNIFNGSSIFSTLEDQTKFYIKGFLPNGSMSGSGVFYADLPGFSSWLLFFIFLLGIYYFIRKHNILGIASIVVISVTSVFLGILTVNPPAPQRLIHTFPFIITLVCFGIIYIYRLIRLILPKLDYKKYLAIITAILVIANICSFIRSNIPAYYRFFNTDVSDISNISKFSNKPLFINAPVHKIDQIYFFSKGQVKPVIINSCFKLNENIRRYQEISFVLDDSGLKMLSQCKSENLLTLLEKEWYTIYDHTYLYKVSYSHYQRT